MTTRKALILAVAGALMGATVFVGYRYVRAEGVPSQNPLRYSGTLEQNGSPMNGQHAIAVRLWSDPVAGGDAFKKCDPAAQNLDVVNGSFSVPLDATCVQAIHANQELWIEVVVDGVTLPRSKIGAVPYALQADMASTAGGALNARIQALEDKVATLPPPTAGNVGMTKRITQTNVANGECVDLVHGWNTRELGYNAWYSEPNGPEGQPTWVPVQPGYDTGTNIALNKTVRASSCNGGPCDTNAPRANDGNPQTDWLAEPNQSDAWWQVDLVDYSPISKVLVQGRTPSNPDFASTSWDILVSQDGNTFSTPVASDTCVPNSSCESLRPSLLPSGTYARYVRIHARSSWDSHATYGPTAVLAEVEVISARYTVYQKDVNTLSFCNHTGSTRDLSLVAWH